MSEQPKYEQIDAGVRRNSSAVEIDSPSNARTYPSMAIYRKTVLNSYMTTPMETDGCVERNMHTTHPPRTQRVVMIAAKHRRTAYILHSKSKQTQPKQRRTKKVTTKKVTTKSSIPSKNQSINTPHAQSPSSYTDVSIPPTSDPHRPFHPHKSNRDTFQRSASQYSGQH